MRQTVIDELKKAKPNRRPKIVQAIHDRNVAFFKRRNPILGEALDKLGTGGFMIRFNQDFLDVFEVRTNEYAHPPGKLLEYIETVASWHHTGWIDKMEVLHRYIGENEHSAVLRGFYDALHAQLPKVDERMRGGIINLPRLQDGRRFSGSTVFLGALTGLHIVHYLNTTEVRDIFIIEPDIHKFALSCWFVDYEAIEKRFNRLVLHVGDDMPESPLDYLMGASPVVAGVWLRFLPIYHSPYFEEVLGRTNLRWRSIHEIMVPFDRELRNLVYGAANLRAEYPILSLTPKLSSGSRIAVVGSGPSLENDIPWLKKNRSRLIIIAVHSSVRVLRKHGIKPDFQATLDTEMLDDLPKLQLDTEVPFIVYYKADPRALKDFKTVLMVHENGKANVVRFNKRVTYTHPTSGNLAVSVALHFQASETYLFGLDLGFRDAARSHATGTWHDDDDGAGHGDAAWRDSVGAKANFEDSQGLIYTHSYYNYSRTAVETAIKTLTDGGKVFNCSDGVRIEGAEPCRSAEVELPAYRNRQKDMAAIQAAFVRGREGVWEPYPLSGETLLKEMSEALLDAVTIKRPDWLSFAAALDQAFSRVLLSHTAKHGDDLRVEVYSRLIPDLLADWYRVMVFTRTPEEFRTGYKVGLENLRILISKLQWPKELDFADEN